MVNLKKKKIRDEKANVSCDDRVTHTHTIRTRSAK